MVGQVTMRIRQSTATALATSRTLPPPMPTEMSAPASRAICVTRARSPARGLALELDVDHFQPRRMQGVADGLAHDPLHARIPQDQRFLAQQFQVVAQLAEHASALNVFSRCNQYGFHCCVLPGSGLTKSSVFELPSSPLAESRSRSASRRRPGAIVAGGLPSAWGCCERHRSCCRPGAA